MSASSKPFMAIMPTAMPKPSESFRRNHSDGSGRRSTRIRIGYLPFKVPVPGRSRPASSLRATYQHHPHEYICSAVCDQLSHVALLHKHSQVYQLPVVLKKMTTNTTNPGSISLLVLGIAMSLNASHNDQQYPRNLSTLTNFMDIPQRSTSALSSWHYTASQLVRSRFFSLDQLRFSL